MDFQSRHIYVSVTVPAFQRPYWKSCYENYAQSYLLRSYYFVKCAVFAQVAKACNGSTSSSYFRRFHAFHISTIASAWSSASRRRLNRTYSTILTKVTKERVRNRKCCVNRNENKVVVLGWILDHGGAFQIASDIARWQKSSWSL